MTGQNPEQVPSTITAATRLAALQRSVEELDRELDDLANGASAPRRDVAVDATSLAGIDELLVKLGDAAGGRSDLTWSAPPAPLEARADVVVETRPAVEAAPAVAAALAEDAEPIEAPASIEPTPLLDAADGVHDGAAFDGARANDASATVFAVEEPDPAILSFPPVIEPPPVEETAASAAADEPHEEDIPRRLLNFAEPAAQSDALATIVDMPDLDVALSSSASSALETLLVAPEGVAPPSAQSSLPLLDEPLFLSEPPAMPVADLALDATPAASDPTAMRDPAPELGAAVESMLIDEDEVVVEAAASTPPVVAAVGSTPPAAEAQLVVDTEDVLVMETPAAATGTLLGLAPAIRPSSRPSGGLSDGDLGEIVFNLEPELEVAKPATAVPRSAIVSNPPQRPRDSVVGISGSRPPRSRDSLDNLELDLSELMPGEVRPPSLRPPPLLRQPPPTPPQRSAPPPVPRASKPLVEVEEIVELDEQEVEVLRASSRPPPAVESKAPPPVPQRPGGQK